jgi:hypothetical protein
MLLDFRRGLTLALDAWKVAGFVAVGLAIAGERFAVGPETGR